MPAPIQLYSLATPNGQKIGIALEEMGLEYEAHTVNITKNEQFAPEFLKISPNNKIPALVDNDGPDGKPISLFESGAMLLYLADKTGKFGGASKREHWEVTKWLMWQMGGFGPMLGQMGHFFKYAPEDVPYAKNRYLTEAKRLYGVLDKQLSENEYVAGANYTIADMAVFPWCYCVKVYYGLGNEFTEFENVEKWYNRIAERPAVQRGLKVTPFS